VKVKEKRAAVWVLSKKSIKDENAEASMGFGLKSLCNVSSFQIQEFDKDMKAGVLVVLIFHHFIHSKKDSSTYT
jgi:hypothetical protein